MFQKDFEGLTIVVDQTRDDCNKEPAHCHVKKYGRRVAQIMVEPSVYASHSDLSGDQTERVENFVKLYRSEIISEYTANAKKW